MIGTMNPLFADKSAGEGNNLGGLLPPQTPLRAYAAFTWEFHGPNAGSQGGNIFLLDQVGPGILNF